MTCCSKHPDHPLNPAWDAASSAGEDSPKQERALGFSVKRVGTKSCSGSDPAELYFGLLDGHKAFFWEIREMGLVWQELKDKSGQVITYVRKL